MQELDDIGLLREFTERNSEQAFAALIERHISKVYSVALRHTRNPDSAEEITQVVFVILTQKAKQLRKGVILEGWLYETARLTAVTFIRSEIRRTRREQEAHMQTILNENESEAWAQIAPELDAALAGLNSMDRNAVVLRFFYGKSMGEIGATLGGTEEGARKRVNRAIEKLRAYFSTRGITSTAAIIAGAISANAVQAAPAALIKTTTAVALAKGAVTSTSTLTLLRGALKIMAWTKAKTAMVVGFAAILAIGTTTTLEIHHQHQIQLQTDFPRSSWRNAGYADPVSAFETAFWATSQNDGKTIFASLAPALQQQLRQHIGRDLNSPEEFLSQDKNSGNHLQGITGFRLLKSEIALDDQALLRLSMQGRHGEQVFKMKKIGNEWKMDDFPSGF